jgi:hypothetical protein
VCSTTAARIARVCRAIEELASNSSERGCGPPAVAAAAQPGDAAQPDHRAGRAAVTGEGSSAGAASGDVADRLAAIWAMIADVDPELARRLPGYLGAVD